MAEPKFDRWVEGSPDVLNDAEAAFTEALNEGTSYASSLQSDAAAFQSNGEGNVGSVTETVVD